jgi:hypothetical protein
MLLFVCGASWDQGLLERGGFSSTLLPMREYGGTRYIVLASPMVFLILLQTRVYI